MHAFTDVFSSVIQFIVNVITFQFVCQNIGKFECTICSKFLVLLVNLFSCNKILIAVLSCSNPSKFYIKKGLAGNLLLKLNYVPIPKPDSTLIYGKM